MPARPKVAVVGARWSLEIEEEVLGPLGVELAQGPGDSPQAVLELCLGAVGVLAGSAPRFTAEVLAQLPDLRVISRYGVGVEAIDLAAATEYGVIVTFLTDYCVEEVATHTLALMLACVRKLPTGQAETGQGRWSFAPVRPVHRLRGRVLGLVGFGRIARRVAGMAAPLGLEIRAYDPYVKEADEVRLVGLEQLLAESDIVSLHAPVTAETHHLINRESLARMKPGAFLINCSRGGLVDEEALLEALDSGRLAGVGVDVLEDEPPEPDRPLLGDPRVIVTPHYAWYSEESQRDGRYQTAQEVARVLKGERPRNVANPEVLERL